MNLTFVSVPAALCERQFHHAASALSGQGMVKVRPLDQKRLLGVAGRHAVITDRKIEDGGSDIGCTSGELLLLAIGSCAAGSLRNFLTDAGLAADGLEVDVELEPSPIAGERDAIAIRVSVPVEVLDEQTEAIAAAALSGRVVSRMRLGSRVVVRIRPPDGRPQEVPAP